MKTKRFLLGIILILTAAISIAADTEVVTWGGQVSIPVPQHIRDERRITAIASGELHNVGLLTTGETVGWGSTSITDNRFTPITATDLAGFVHPTNGQATAVIKICAGWEHTAYQLNNDMVITRGANSLNRVGSFPFAGDPTTGVTIMDITCGGEFTAVSYYIGGANPWRIKVWGRITAGGPTAPRLIQAADVNVNNPPWNFSIAALKLAGGAAHLAWTMNSTNPKMVTGVGDFNALPQNGNSNNTGAEEIVAGNNCTLWRNSSGNVYGVGGVSTGYSGFVSGNNLQMAMGVGHELMLKSTPEGSMTAFAYSSNNQYGQATVPAFLSGVVKVAAGRYHSTALISRKEKPTLTFTITGAGTGTLMWPGTYPEYNSVEGSSEAGGPYSVISGTPILSGGMYTFPVTFSGPQGFFRLKRTF